MEFSRVQVSSAGGRSSLNVPRDRSKSRKIFSKIFPSSTLLREVKTVVLVCYVGAWGILVI